MRPTRQALGVALVKRFDGGATPLGVAAHLVERGERRDAVKGGIFKPLGDHRTRELLEAQDKIPACGPLGLAEPHGIVQQQDGGDEFEERGAHGRVPERGQADGRGDVLAVLLAHGGLGGADVGPVDGETGDHLAQGRLQTKEREILRPAVLFGNPLETAR